MRTRVKICGITRPEDAQAAAAQGVDAIGLVFYPPSPRALDAERARQVVEDLPAFVSTVALFVNPGAEAVRVVIEAVAPDLLQFHGDESAVFCASFGRPYIKALKVREGHDVGAQARAFGGARGILLDTYDPVHHGGTGIAFDWSLVPRDLARPLILAGGLNPSNVAAAIEQVRPWAVDVSGGVESARGIKDPDRIAAFMRGVDSVCSYSQ